MMGGFSAVLLNDLFGGPDQGHAPSLVVLVALPVSNGIDISRFGRLVLVVTWPWLALSHQRP